MNFRSTLLEEGVIMDRRKKEAGNFFLGAMERILKSFSRRNEWKRERCAKRDDEKSNLEDIVDRLPGKESFLGRGGAGARFFLHIDVDRVRFAADCRRSGA